MLNVRTSAAAIIILLAGTASAQQLTTTRVATGLALPIFACSPPGDTSRLFIVEQRGSGGVSSQAQIKILNLATNTINPTPFLTLGPLAAGGEQGLLGMAFDPNYAANGRFFLFYVNTSTASVIARYLVSAGNPDVADPTSGSIILTQPHPGDGHNGGWLGFGADGYLYASLGDGGPWFDPNGYGQNLTVLFGKILRLDVSAGGPGYAIPSTNPFAGSATNRKEIWAYGLRNPWRDSFDRQTGDLWIADVGQDLWEEIDFHPRFFDPPYPAVNYGWRCFEANIVQNTTVGPDTGGVACSTITNFTSPIHAYPHNPDCSVIGGYVYRGRTMPWLRGTYFFADYCSGRISTFDYAGGTVQHLTNRKAELTRPGFVIDQIVSFGEDGNGELYICDQGGGEVFKIIARCLPNCDGSTISPVLNANDFQCFLNAFASGDPYANCDASTAPPILNANDFQCFLNQYAAGCS